MGVRKWLSNMLFKDRDNNDLELKSASQLASTQVLYMIDGYSTSSCGISRAVQDGMKSSVWVMRCVSLRAEQVSSVPWIVERYNDGVWERDEGHPLERLLRRPNPHISGNDFFGLLSVYRDLTGVGPAHIVTVRGTPQELWTIRPDYLDPETDGKGGLKAVKYLPERGRILKPNELLLFLNRDPARPWWGMSVIQAASRIIEADNDAVLWNRNAMKRRAVKDFAFTPKNEVLKPEQWERMRQALAEHEGSSNPRGFMVIGVPGEIQPLTMSAVEMDFINSRRWNMKEICAAFGVPDVLLHGESTYHNLRDSMRWFWLTSVVPILDDLRDTLNNTLIPYYDEDAKYGRMPRLRINYDLSAIPFLQENMSEKIDNARKLLEMGYPLNAINQRLGLGFDDIEGGDEPFMLQRQRQQETAFGFLSGMAKSTHIEKKASAWEEERKARFWHSFEEDRKRWEERIASVIGTMFDREAEVVVEAYERDGEDGVNAAIDSMRGEWEQTLTTVYQVVIEYFGERESERLLSDEKAIKWLETKQEELPGFDFTFRFRLFGERISRWIAAHAAQKVTQMAETTKERLGRLIGEAVTEYKPKTTIARMIRDLYHEWASPTDSSVDTYRSYMIARTEVGAAANYANYEGAKQIEEETGLTVRKQWISSRDRRTRESHLDIDGETVGLDERFSNGLLYPGDPTSDDAGEVINCRCTVAHVIE